SPPALPLRGLRIAAIACLKRERTILEVLAESDRWNATTLRDAATGRGASFSPLSLPFWMPPCRLRDATRLKAIAIGRSLPQTDEAPLRCRNPRHSGAPTLARAGARIASASKIIVIARP